VKGADLCMGKRNNTIIQEAEPLPVEERAMVIDS
jgi:hypothetical protein